jgi:hypothetical protein
MSSFLNKVVGYFYPQLNRVEIEKKIETCYENEQYSEVIELTSQLDWKNKPLSSKVASCFLRSMYFNKGGNKDEIWDLSDVFLNFYGDVSEKEDFEYLKALILEKKADAEYSNKKHERAIELYGKAHTWVAGSNYKKTSSRITEKLNKTKEEFVLLNLSIHESKGDSEIVNKNFQKGIEFFNSANSWALKSTDKQNAVRLKEKIKKAEVDQIQFNALNLESKADLMVAKGKYEEGLELYTNANQWALKSTDSKISPRIIQKIDNAKVEWEKKKERDRVADQERSYLLARSLTEFPELADVISPLSKGGIESVRDLYLKDNVEIDKIRGITPEKMAIISSFKSEHNL